MVRFEPPLATDESVPMSEVNDLAYFSPSSYILLTLPVRSTSTLSPHVLAHRLQPSDPAMSYTAVYSRHSWEYVPSKGVAPSYTRRLCRRFVFGPASRRLAGITSHEVQKYFETSGLRPPSPGPVSSKAWQLRKRL